MKIHLNNGFSGIPPVPGGSSADGTEKTQAEKFAEELKRLKEAAEALQASESARTEVQGGQVPSRENQRLEGSSGSEERKCSDLSDAPKALLYTISTGNLFDILNKIVF